LSLPEGLFFGYDFFVKKSECFNPEGEKMSLYEAVFVARQDMALTQVEKLAEACSKTVEDLGGKVTKTEHWGLRALAYKINKNRKGYYVLLNIDAPGAAVIELDRTMRINEDVLRHLIVKVDELEAGPSAMMLAKGEKVETKPTSRFAKKDDKFGDKKGYKPKRKTSENDTAGDK